MGLLDMLGYGSNPFYKAFDQNRGKIGGAFSGMVGAGNDPRMALQGFVGGLQHGQSVDQENLIIAQKKAEQDAAAKAEQDKQNQTISWLQQNAPKYADAVKNGAMSPGDAWNAALKDQGGSPIMDETWGLTPQAYKIGEEIKIGVVSNKGNFKEVQLPNGAQPMFPVQQLNTGTGFTETSKFGGTTGGVIPIDNQGAAQATATGKAIGEQLGDITMTAPKAELQKRQATDLADRILLNEAGMDEAFGTFGVNVFGTGIGIPQQMTPAWPGTKKADFTNDVTQLIEKSWLTVRQDLKGAGQVTDYEGAKAERAVSQMGLALKSGSKGAFIKAVNDYKAAVDAAYAIIAKQAALSGGAPPIQSPQTTWAPNTTLTGVQWSVGP